MAGRRLALVMLGDCMLGRIVDESLTALPAQQRRLWGDVLPLLSGGMAAAGEAQLNVANLECSVTAEEQPDESRTFNFKLSPANVPALTCVPERLRASQRRRRQRWRHLAAIRTVPVDCRSEPFVSLAPTSFSPQRRPPGLRVPGQQPLPRLQAGRAGGDAADAAGGRHRVCRRGRRRRGGGASAAGARRPARGGAQLRRRALGWEDGCCPAIAAR